MEHEEAPGVASLLKGQPSFPLRSLECADLSALWYQSSAKAPYSKKTLKLTKVILLLLLDLDISEFESCWIWIGGVPILGRENYIV